MGMLRSSSVLKLFLHDSAERTSIYRRRLSLQRSPQRFVDQRLGLTRELDKVSEVLFSLTTNGGDEYCGYVIAQAGQPFAVDAYAAEQLKAQVAESADTLNEALTESVRKQAVSHDFVFAE